jgi:hypothetical protein
MIGFTHFIGKVVAAANFFSLQHVPTAMNRDSQDTPEVRV